MERFTALVHTLPLNKVTKSCCDAKMQPSVKLNNPQRNRDQEVFLHQQLLSTWSKCWELELIPTNQLWFHYFTLPQVQRRNI